jgi:hypothetical protein
MGTTIKSSTCRVKNSSSEIIPLQTYAKYSLKNFKSHDQFLPNTLQTAMLLSEPANKAAVTAMKATIRVPDCHAMLLPCKFCISGAMKNATIVRKRKIMEMIMSTT